MSSSAESGLVAGPLEIPSSLRVGPAYSAANTSPTATAARNPISHPTS
jgi:hypothetical protein